MTAELFFLDAALCVIVHLVSASPYKPGNLFTVPVNREEDAELIWLIARVLDAAAATDLIYLLFLDCFTERVVCDKCIVGSSVCLRKRYREGGREAQGGEKSTLSFQIQLQSRL